MAEHLHGHPRCDTPAGTPCGSSDLNWDECKNFGALQACEASVVDGIPTGQYHCSHAEIAARAPSAPKAKSKKAAKAKVRPKKKAGPKARAKKGAKRAPKKGAKKTRPAKKKAAGRGGRARKGARKKK